MDNDYNHDILSIKKATIMTFPEKLVFLMQLTFTTNKQLAEVVGVDPSLISLLRTARRKLPKNLTHIKAMAIYFAKKCEGNYQRMALSEAMGRKYLQIQMDTNQLAAILLEWLTDGRDQVARFLHTFESFSFEEGNAEASMEAPVEMQKSRYDARSFAYYGNEGKRGAFSAFIQYLLSLDTRGTILFSTDESLEWLLEDSTYLARTREQMLSLLNKGYRVRRIAAPIHTTEQAFDSLSQLIPFYLTGQVESYYYPRLRDNVYRRTVIALPNVASIISTSIGEQPVSRATVFTQDKRFTNALVEEFNDFLDICRPMMTTYSTVGNSDELLRCILKFESDPGNRIQQSTSLSAITSPAELIQLTADALPPQEAADIIGTMGKAQEVFKQSLLDYETIDIHALATAEEVRAGVVPITVAYLRQTAPIRHTPETYALHLRSILDHIERYEKYHVVLRRRDEQIHALLVKDGRQALLLRPGTPLTVFEISQPYIAEACREYLARVTESPLSPVMQRQETISRICQLIKELECS